MPWAESPPFMYYKPQYQDVHRNISFTFIQSNPADNGVGFKSNTSVFVSFASR
jgi:hypothetical protein